MRDLWYLESDRLMREWQDNVLANLIVTNELSVLLVLASRADFSLVNASNQCTAHISSPNSFRQTASQLSDNIRRVFRGSYEDLRRIHLVLERFPLHLKTILLLVKKGRKALLETSLPLLLDKSAKMVRESLTILKNPPSKFEEVNDLLVELDSLVSSSPNAYVISLQVNDVQTQWMFLTSLFTEVAQQADRTSQQLLLQFNWILEEFLPSIDSSRDLLINLLKSKLIEIDRTIDLLGIISQTYLDISTKYTNDKLAGNTHLILLANEEDRKRIIQQYRHEIPAQAVHVARLALQRHDEFLQRNQQRSQSLERFLNESTASDINLLLSMNDK